MPLGLLSKTSKTNDIVFKGFLQENKSCIADLLKSILNILDSEFEHLEFVDYTSIAEDQDLGSNS